MRFSLLRAITATLLRFIVVSGKVWSHLASLKAKRNYRPMTGATSSRSYSVDTDKEIVMKIRLSLAVAVVVIAGAIAAIISTTGSSARKVPTVPANSAISVRQTSLGKTLVDANGRTLYLFANDKPNVSTLSAAGRAFWPPFTATIKPVASGGAAAGHLGTVTGTTGAAQVTYNGHPLYYFIGDHSSGQTTGEGLNQFGARWYVLSPSGTAITSAPTAGPPSAPSGGGSVYGY